MNHELERLLWRDFMEIAALPLPWKELKGKSILVTGGTGFIGSYLIKCLCWLNRQMSLDISFQLLRRSGAKLPFTDPCVRWIEGDIAEEFIPEDVVPDIIIHAASPANRRAISADPVGVVNCNITATNYLLENARRNNALFLFFSSGEVYQKQSGQIAEAAAEGLAENSVLPLYGNCKLSGELLCRGYHQRYGVDCRVLRLFSIFGPGEPLTSGRCFTDFLRQALETKAIQITGSGTQIRSYCYLSDFVSGLLHVLLMGESTVYNIGNENNVCSILELAGRIAEVNGETELIGPLAEENGTDSYVPDTSQLRRLGWRPRVDLRTCIRRCFHYYQIERGTI